MTHRPEISVIVPVYRVEEYLRRCIDSILGQTFKDFELILVDDGSPDGCGAICDEYKTKDSRVVVIHQRNQGVSAARNAGIDWAFANSKSRYITFIDSDDWVDSIYLDELHKGVQGSDGIAAVGFRVVNKSFDLSKDCQAAITWETKSAEEFWTGKNVLAATACGKIYEKKLFSDVRYPIGIGYEDEYTTYKLIFKLRRCAISCGKLYYYYMREGSATHSKFPAKRLDRCIAWRNQIDFFTRLNKPKLARRSLRLMMVDYIDVIKQSDDDALVCQCRKELRKCIREYGVGSLLNIRAMAAAYQIVGMILSPAFKAYKMMLRRR